MRLSYKTSNTNPQHCAVGGTFQVTQSYEQLINKRSRVIQALNKAGKILGEKDFQQLLQTDYSCLKRPILHWNNSFYFGNAKKTVAAMQQAVHE